MTKTLYTFTAYPDGAGRGYAKFGDVDFENILYIDCHKIQGLIEKNRKQAIQEERCRIILGIDRIINQI